MTSGQPLFEPLEGSLSKSNTPSLPRGTGGGRIEPAEPEQPPAHSLGRVDEDVMGRSGQLVRPGSLDTGGVALWLVARNWWRGWW